MYKKIETDESCMWGTNPHGKPVVTLMDEESNKIQIIIDDNCYVLLKRQQNGICKEIFRIPPGVLKVLKKLPLLK